MPKRRAGATLLPWITAKPDGKERRFIQVGNGLMLDSRFQALSSGARWLYLALCMEAGGKRAVAFPHRAAKKYGIAPTSFDRQVLELRKAGFVERVEDGDFAQFAPAVYRFSLVWRTESAPQPGEG